MSSTLTLKLIIGVLLAVCVVGQSCARGVAYYDTTGCTNTELCAMKFCTCLGQTRAGAGNNTCSNPGGVAAPSCALFSSCYMNFTSCIAQLAQIARGQSDISCALPEVYAGQLLIASGVSYSGSTLQAECQRTQCRLASEFKVVGNLNTSLYVLNTFNGSANSTCGDSCLSPVTSSINLQIGGFWQKMLSVSANVPLITAAARTDLQKLLGVPVAVQSVSSGSLIVKAIAYDGPTPDLQSRINNAASTASVWLSAIKSFYVSNGGDANDIVLLSITSDAVPPTPTYPPVPPVNTSLCDGSCVAAIVIVCLIGLAFIILSIVYCCSLRKTKKLVDNGIFADRPKLKHQLEWLVLRPEEALACLNLISRKVADTAPPVTADGEEPLSPYDSLMLLAHVVTDVVGANCLAQFFVERHILEVMQLPIQKEKIEGFVNVMIDRIGSWLPKKKRLMTRSEAQERHATQFAKRYRQLFNGFDLTLLAGYLRAFPAHITEEDALSDDQVAVLSLVYGLMQPDTPERLERATYLGFSYDEAMAMIKYMRDEAVLHEGEYHVTRKRFVRAYTAVKGHAPDVSLVERIYPHRDWVMEPDDFINNVTTSDTESRDRSFLYFYARQKLDKAYTTELAAKFFPFLVLFVVYMSVGNGMNEAYYFTKLNSEYLTTERFPPLPDNFPASCTPNCQFWSSLYQGMMADIALPADLQNWLNGPVIDRFWPTPGATAAAPIAPAVMAIGALRVRQIRVASVFKPEQYAAYFGVNMEGYTPQQQAVVPKWWNTSDGGLGTTYPAYASSQNTDSYGSLPSGVDRSVVQAFTYRTESQLNHSSLRYRGRQSAFPNDGFALDIPFNYTREQAIAAMKATLGANWLDLQTRFLVVEVMVYSRDLQAVGRQRYAVELTAGGVYIPSWDAFVYPLFDVALIPNVYFGFMALYLAVIFFMVIPGALYGFFWRIPRKIVRFEGRRGFVAHLRGIVFFSCTDSWAVLSLLNAMLLVATWCMRFYWMYYGVNRIGTQIIQVEYFPAHLDQLAFVMQSLTYVHAANIGVVALMVLSYLSRYESLALIIDTVKKAAAELASLLFVFVILLTAFALASHIAFGTHLLEYATMARSYGSILIATTGGLDYDAWKGVHVNYAPVLYTLFMVLMVLLLLSMVVTVLMDSFQAVVDTNYDPEPLNIIMENDNFTRLSSPTFWETVSNASLVNFLKKIVRYSRLKGRQLVFKLQQCCGCEIVPHDFSYKEELTKVNRLDQYRFWKGLSFAVELVQNKSVFDAVAGHHHIASLLLPLVPRSYDAIMPPPHFAGDDEAQFPPGPEAALITALPTYTVFEKLYEEYKSSTRKVLRLFQELPNYYLQVPTALLLQELQSSRHKWRQLIDDYTMGDDDDDALPALDAVNYAVSIRDELIEAGIKVACNRGRLVDLPRKRFAFGGFVPLITSSQAQKIRERFEAVVEDRLSEPGPVPYGVTIGELADIFRELFISRFRDDDEGSHETCMQPVEFRCISQSVTMHDGRSYEFVGRLSLETLLERGIQELNRRKQFTLAQGWEAHHVVKFIRGASEYAAQNNVPFRLTDAVLDPTTLAPTDAFAAGWKHATGVSFTHSMNVTLALTELTYNEFFNFATKSIGEHSQHAFLDHFARRQMAISGETYNLMWYFIFVILYSIYAVSGRGLGEGANLQISTQELMATQQYVWPQVNKTDDQWIYINNMDDWNGFMSQIIFSTIYANPTDQTGQMPLPNLAISTVGAIKIRQLRSHVYDCSTKLRSVTKSPSTYGYTGDYATFYAGRISQFFQPICTASYNIGDDFNDPFGKAFNNASFFTDSSIPKYLRDAWRYQSCSDLRGSGIMATDYSHFPCGGYALVLPLNMTLNDATNALAYLQNNNWFDGNTAAIIVDITYFQYTINVFSRWRYALKVGSSGSFEPTYLATNFKPFVSSNYGNVYLGFLGVFLLMLLLQIVLFLWNFATDYSIIRSRGQGRARSFAATIASDPWHFINFIGFSLFIASWTIRATLMVTGVSKMKIYDSNAFVTNVEAQAELYESLNIVDSVIAVITYGRLLSFFHLIPRLNLLGRTITLAFKNIGSLTFVFGVTFWAFGVVAYTIYGTVYVNFATLTRTFASLFRVLVDDDGAINYSELSQLHPVYAGIFYTCFLIACQFVLFNLIVAMLNEAFGRAREEQYNFEPFRETMLQDAHAKRNLQGASGFIAIDVLVNELALAVWVTVWLLTYPFVGHVTRMRFKNRFYRNPRYFWAKAVECFSEPNPAHAWYCFVDEVCDAKQLLGVTSQISMSSNRIAREDYAASPSKTRGRSASPSGTLRNYNPNASFASAVLAMSSIQNDSITFNRRILEEVNQIREADDINASFHNNPLEVATRDIFQLGPAIPRVDIQQSYHQGDATKMWRVKRVQDVLSEALADELDDGWVLICIAAHVTGLHRRHIAESMLQEMHMYRRKSQIYDGRTVTRLADVYKEIATVTKLVIDASAEPKAAFPTISPVLKKLCEASELRKEEIVDSVDLLGAIRAQMQAGLSEVKPAAALPTGTATLINLGVGESSDAAPASDATAEASPAMGDRQDTREPIHDNANNGNNTNVQPNEPIAPDATTASA